MDGTPEAEPDSDSDGAGAVRAFLDGSAALPVDELAAVSRLAADLLGAESARLLIADYAMLSLRELTDDGPTGPRELIVGTTAGRAFASGDVVVSRNVVWIPLMEESERFGVLELTLPDGADLDRSLVDTVVRLLVLELVGRRRYTDTLLRARRSQPLSLAAEMQWGLLPPLSCSTAQVSVSGTLEPAYSIGGDSFDFALNRDVAEFAIIDAVGHGMPAVLISTVAMNGLRNARREERGLSAAYDDTGAALKEQFTRNAFVTGQIGSLALDTGLLTWLNAGPPLPLLVRNGRFVRELPCAPSLPMGLGGSVREIASEPLHPGDRVLFYTDGVTETTALDGTVFGLDRLVDFFVRATLQESAPAETLRQLSAAVLDHSNDESSGDGLNDDATLLMLEYHGAG